MEVLWILNSDPDQARDSTEDTASKISAIFFALAEVWCIVCTAKTLMSSMQRADMLNIVFYMALHFMLVLRILSLVESLFGGYHEYVNRAFGSGTVIAKDVFTLALVCRMLGALDSSDGDKNPNYNLLQKLTYMFMGLHFLIFYGLLLAFCANEVERTTLSIYCASVETLITVLYGYCCLNFLALWGTLDEASRRSPMMRWLRAIVIYFIPAMLWRITFNVAMFFNLGDYLDQHTRLRVMYTLSGAAITELIPAVMMCTYMFLLETESPSFVESQAEPLEDNHEP